MSRPTTTGGRPMKALSTTIRLRRPGKRPTATAAPIRKPTTLATSTAVRLICRLRTTTESSFASSSATSRRAVIKLPERVSMSAARGAKAGRVCCLRHMFFLHCAVILRATRRRPNMSKIARYRCTVQCDWRLAPESSPPEEHVLIGLLQAIAETGALGEAARRSGVSYRNAWGMLRRWEDRLGQALVRMEQGKGSTLTRLAEE